MQRSFPLYVLLLLGVNAPAADLISISVDPAQACCYTGLSDGDHASAIQDHPAVIAKSGLLNQYYVHATFSNGDRGVFFRLAPLSSIQFFGIPGTFFDINNKPICSLANVSTEDPDNRATAACVPTVSDLQVEWLYCIVFNGTFNVTWGGQTFHPDDYFKAERQIFGNYYPWYEGDPGCMPYTTSSSGAHIRVKAVSIWGESAWFYANAANSCGSVPD